LFAIIFEIQVKGLRMAMQRGLLLCGLVLLAAGCARHSAPPPHPGAEWTMNGFNTAEQRYSPLALINTRNAARLGLGWKFDEFVVRGRVHRGNQGTPLVVAGVLYATGPWSVVYALDAKTGRKLWVYDPGVEGAWARRACCDVNNKGVAYHDGRIYVGVIDGYLDALDARTGERLWRVDTLTDRSRSYTVTGAPRIAGPNIVIGNGGADMDARGYISAYNLETGKLAWRFFTVPGDPARPDEHPEITVARKTWGEKSRWDLGGGGTVYDAMAYDPELGLLYAGTSNGVPHPSWLRDPTGGDNLYLSSILAIDAVTGRLRWHYQTTPADSWDFGATQNMILAELDMGGKRRKVIMQAPKNGFFYVLDRATGELLSADKYAEVTWASHVDLRTGRPVLNAALSYQKSPKIIWPSVSGAHNWQPMAFNPATGLVYIPALEAPMKYVSYQSVSHLPGSLNEGKGPPLMPPFQAADAPLLVDQPGVRAESVLRAWDPVARKVAWESPSQPWWSGGLLTTAGGLVLQGSTDGIFKVFDAASGKLLKSIETGLATLAPPMTYAIDDEQYIAVLAGLGGSESAYFPAQSAALKYRNPETLFVFKLDGGKVELPPLLEADPRQPAPQPISTDAATLSHGAGLFYHHCARCHSYRGSPGAYPNLWNMAPGTHAAFKSILLDGAFAYAGMAPFKDILSVRDADAIHAFIVNDQLSMLSEGNHATEARFFSLDEK
jgi:quinohemoprotein ethanol dehydrogenase